MSTTQPLPQESSHLVRHEASALGLQSEHISTQALSVVQRLCKAGHEAYIVGGSIRDFLLGIVPKDFDIATSAYPKQIVRLFSHSRIIGRRFKIVHVYGRERDSEILEVTTFRSARNPQKQRAQCSKRGGHAQHRKIIRDNQYGTLKEDILRRDFTVNAIYYDPINQKVVAHKDALDDVSKRRLKCIQDVWECYSEDPVRMLRALRLSIRANLSLSGEEAECISQSAHCLEDVSPGRLFEEVNRLFYCGHARQFYASLEQHALASVLFPPCYSEQKEAANCRTLLKATATYLDARKLPLQTKSYSFIAAVLLWVSLPQHIRQTYDQVGKDAASAQSVQELKHAARRAQKLSAPIAIPHRFREPAIQACALQAFFTSRRLVELNFLLLHKNLRLAWHLFCLRAEARLADPACVEWWKKLQSCRGAEQAEMLKQRATAKPASSRNKHVHKKRHKSRRKHNKQHSL